MTWMYLDRLLNRADHMSLVSVGNLGDVFHYVNELCSVHINPPVIIL